MQTSQFMSWGFRDSFSAEIKFLIGTLPRPFAPSQNVIGRHLPHTVESFEKVNWMHPTFSNLSVGGSVVPSNGGSESIKIPMMSSQPSPSFGSLSHWWLTKSAYTASTMVPVMSNVPSLQRRSQG